MANDEFREDQESRRQFGKAKQHEKRLENATYTAAEVKVLTETAAEAGRRIGHQQAVDELTGTTNAVLVLVATDLLAELGDWSPSVQAMLNETPGVGTGYELIFRTVSQPSGATSDATSWVPRHPEVSEAPKAPQEPCGHPTCPCASQEAK